MRRRNGFTLVELLVAMALIVFIMAVLSQAFVAATRSFRDLKSAGDLAAKLRSVSAQLRRDLAADHFEGKRRLSDPTFWADGPPRQGFFRLYQGSRPVRTDGLCLLEGVDADGLRSYRSADHQLHFTVKLRGNPDGEFFTASVPAGSPLLTGIFGPAEARYQGGTAYRNQWAEVAYFLRPAVDANNHPDTANGTPLFSLYRRQRVAVPDNGLVAPAQRAGAAPEYLEVSCGPDRANPRYLFFNSPLDLTVPSRRFATNPNGRPAVTVADFGPTYPTLAEQTADANLRGADLALTDVVSFDVRLLLLTDPSAYRQPSDPNNPFVDLFDPSVDVYDNRNATLFARNGPRAFDTWSSYASTVADLDYGAWDAGGGPKSIPMWNAGFPAGLRGPVVKAVQITIRVWDVKTSLTRQVTVVQAM
jgi:prepilin-type N-terminal cleavage/methylation domain-containing protein